MYAYIQHKSMLAYTSLTDKATIYDKYSWIGTVDLNNKLGGSRV